MVIRRRLSLTRPVGGPGAAWTAFWKGRSVPDLTPLLPFGIRTDAPPRKQKGRNRDNQRRNNGNQNPRKPVNAPHAPRDQEAPIGGVLKEPVDLVRIGLGLCSPGGV